MGREGDHGLWPDRWERRAAVRNMREKGENVPLNGLDPFSGVVFGYHDAGGDCVCVSEHSPVPSHLVKHHIIPLKWDGPDTDENTVWLCPTAHGNVHKLLWDYERAEGIPPWEGVRWHYSKYIRDLARTAWLNRPRER